MKALASVCITFLLVSASGHAATITAEPLAGTPETGVISIVGTITPGDADAFSQRIAAFPKGIVAFQSDGGNVAEAIAIGLAIRTKGYSTLVISDAICASACAIAWLGGNPLIAGVGAKIGFHAAYFLKDGQASEAGAPNALVGAYFAKIGLSDRAVLYLTSAPPDGMTWLTTADANALGIHVNILPRPEVASPSDTQASTSLPPAAPVAPTPAQTAQSSDADHVGVRLADNFLKRCKKSGMVGLNGSIVECYRQIRLKPQVANASYCIALDLLSSTFDMEVSKELHGEQMEFDKPSAAYARATEILTFLNAPVEDGLNSATSVERAAMAKLTADLKLKASTPAPALPVSNLNQRERLCSAEADARGLHGDERWTFRQECKVGD